jgi:5-methylcytosine-specific restriction enzyme A
MSTKRRTPGVFASPSPKTDKGEKLCRNCRKVVIPKNKHNCSRACSEEWALKTSPSLMRRAVYERDNGVCALCATDTVANREGFRKRKYSPAGSTAWKEKEVLAEYGMTSESGHWWEADHIIPVIEGGGECGLEGYRTLCIPCHRKATKELRARIARRRRDDKALANDGQGLFADQVEA